VASSSNPIRRATRPALDNNTLLREERITLFSDRKVRQDRLITHHGGRSINSQPIRDLPSCSHGRMRRRRCGAEPEHRSIADFGCHGKRLERL
jgi:hypothetical protein